MTAPTKPGCFPFCAGCRHLDAAMANQGHPQPCRFVTWEDARLITPEISAAGCLEFDLNQLRDPTGEAPCNPSPSSI